VSGRLEITNPGNLTAARSRVHFYLSRNRKLDRRDRLLKRLSLARLKAGATRTVAFRRALRRDVSRRFLIARLDATGRVREPNERDNVVVSERLSRKRIRLRIRGSAKRGVASSLRVRVTDANGRALRNATVVVSGAGLERIIGRAGRRGTARFSVTAPRRGTVKIRASRRGHATATAALRVR
jgi:transcription antitermination factor NusA-like protein